MAAALIDRMSPNEHVKPVLAEAKSGAIRCPICDEGGEPHFLAGAHYVYRCTSCRTAFVAPMPDEAYLANFYSNYHVGEGEEGNYANESKMRRKHPVQVELVMKHTALRPGRLLDIGCGKGYFLKECADAGIECAGIELSDTAVRFARSSLGLDVIPGRLDQLGAPPVGAETKALSYSLYGGAGQFDTATMWGVIEHLRDPIGMLRATANVLKPGGKLFVQTGIGDDWLDRLLPGVNQWYDPPQHLFVFSANGMKRSAERTGFRLEHLDTWYDISRRRRYVRAIRNGVAACLLRGVAEVCRLPRPAFQMTKFPLGLSMIAVMTKLS
jgi:SAM-dependent methyltransferase